MGWAPGRVAVGVAGALVVAAMGGGARWGEAGHVMAGRAAASRLPAEMPQFFRVAPDRLGWLNPEPDRWRADAMVEANEAFRYDHYIDLEVVPEAIRAARDRFEYLSALQRTGMQRPSREAGLLPFRIIEMQQRLTIGFAQWRRTTDAREREWLEHRILDDAGILGHYATDAANPHHTTIHHNGWAENTPNPDGYTTERTFHWRFENEFVGSHITFEELLVRLDGDARQFVNVRDDVWQFLRSSHAKVDQLYRLEKQEMFGPDTQSGAHEAFALDRLAAGTDFLRSLWWTAWLNSATL
ncbi:MAG: hypothetical protein ACREL7_15210 [Longimicrobiales bacterium]